jgi:hypothetical protein
MSKYHIREFFEGSPDYGLEVLEKVGNEDTLLALLGILQHDKDFNPFGNLAEEWRRFRQDPARVQAVAKNPGSGFNIAKIQEKISKHNAQVLEKIMPSPYIDWGEKRVDKSEGYITTDWNSCKKNWERMFVFKADIEFAKVCLRRDYEEPTEKNAIKKLCDSRRTGNRRFPRFGWVWPEQGEVLGRKELLKHPGKTSEWNSLYAIISTANISPKIKKQMLQKIDGMEKCDQRLKPVFEGSQFRLVSVRNFYHVHFDQKEMEALRSLLEEHSIPVLKINGENKTAVMSSRADGGSGISEERKRQMLEDMEEIKFVQFFSTLRQKEIIDALSILYEKFPVPSFRNCALFADNREFWETYDRRKHGAKGLALEDLSRITTFALAEMAKYRGTNGVTFFTGNTKTSEKGGISFIEDYGMTPEAYRQYREKYLPSLTPRAFKDPTDPKGGLKVLHYEYTDAFAASLFKAMFGNGKGYGIAGPIDHLTKYAEKVKQLAKDFETIKNWLPVYSRKTAIHISPESLWPQIHVKNLISLLLDLAEEDDEKRFPKGYAALVYALLVTAFPDCEDRYDFFEDRCEFYTNLDVANGGEANRMFESPYKFTNEPTSKNRMAASYHNCMVLDEALRSEEMPLWAAAVMKGFYKNASKELRSVFKSKEAVNLLEMVTGENTEYNYRDGNDVFDRELSLGDSLDRFLGNFYRLDSDLSAALSKANGGTNRIFAIAKKISQKETRFVNKSSNKHRNRESADMAVVQFNFSVQDGLPNLTVAENILIPEDDRTV